MSKSNSGKNNVQAPSAPAAAKPFMLQGWDIVAYRNKKLFYCMPGQCFLFDKSYSKFKRSYCSLRFHIATVDSTTNRIIEDTNNMIAAPVNAFVANGIGNIQYPGGVYDVIAPASDAEFSRSIINSSKPLFSSLITRRPITAQIFQNIWDSSAYQLGDPIPSQYPFLYVERNDLTEKMFGSNSVCTMKICSFDTLFEPVLKDKEMVRTNIPILLRNEDLLAGSPEYYSPVLRREHAYWYIVYTILNRLKVNKLYIGFGPVDPTAVVCDSIMDRDSFEALCNATNNPANASSASTAPIQINPSWDCPRSMFRVDKFNYNDPFEKVDYLRSIANLIAHKGILPQELISAVY